MRFIIIAVMILGMRSTTISLAEQSVESVFQKLDNYDSCHNGPVLPDHTPEFFEKGHGLKALDDRKPCLDCHKEENCHYCHERKKPKWETEAFRRPGRNPKNRDEHLRIAVKHRKTCMECHRQWFHKQCSHCHTLEEMKTLI